jgi:glycosyltransferase involved in cell wall biosynthesis
VRLSLALRRPLSRVQLRRLLSQETPSIYLNTSHGTLYRPAVTRWLSSSAIRAAFLVHDLIPIDFPEFSRAGESARHARRLATIAAHARCVIVNSHSTAEALRRYLAAQAHNVPHIAVLPLGIDESFHNNSSLPLRGKVPYFVAVSTIEPRKNHYLLLQVWRRLVETLGDNAPRLVLIGRRGWENQAVFNLIDRSTVLRNHVVECSGISDAEIASLILGARALLSPSFAEGYGLPVAEALALGTPVIASDIPAHREVGGECVDYLDPLDGIAWLSAITDLAAEHSPRRDRLCQRARGFRPPRWETHFEGALQLMREAALCA